MDAAAIEEWLEYRDGGLWWRKQRQRGCVGKRFGSITRKGYRQGGLFDKQWKEHHLVWILHHGYKPTQLDHINRDKDDNRIENLREVDDVTNQLNQQGAQSNNRSTGVRGVYPSRSGAGTFFAKFRGKRLGTFPTMEAASDAYEAARMGVQ